MMRKNACAVSMPPWPMSHWKAKESISPRSSARPTLPSRVARLPRFPGLGILRLGRGARPPVNCQGPHRHWKARTPVTGSFAIRNVHRTVGAMLGGEIAHHRYGSAGCLTAPSASAFTGSAGRAAAQCPNGVAARGEGGSNDCLGKGSPAGVSINTRPRPRVFCPESIGERRSALRCLPAPKPPTVFGAFAMLRGDLPCAAQVLPAWLRRRRGRPQLRIHDQRHGDRAGLDRAQLRSRHERRVALRPRGLLDAGAATWPPWIWSHSFAEDVVRDARPARTRHRDLTGSLGQPDSGALGRRAAAVHQVSSPHEYKRVLGVDLKEHQLADS